MRRKKWDQDHRRSTEEVPEAEERGVGSGAQNNLWLLKSKAGAHCIMVSALALKNKVMFRW